MIGFRRLAGRPAGSVLVLTMSLVGCAGADRVPEGGPLTGLDRADLLRCAGRPDRVSAVATEAGGHEVYHYLIESSWTDNRRGVDTVYGASGPTARQAASPEGRICKIALALANGKVTGSRFKSTSFSLFDRTPECRRFIRRCGG